MNGRGSGCSLDGRLTCQFDLFGVQVNLDAETRLITLTNVQSNNPDPHAFDRPQRRIQNMMEHDSYQRFLQSQLVLELLYPDRYPRGNGGDAPAA